MRFRMCTNQKLNEAIIDNGKVVNCMTIDLLENVVADAMAAKKMNKSSAPSRHQF